MIFCDLTFESPVENLACDEVLLDLCEEGVLGELLRVWEPTHYFVVLGYANKAGTEVNLPFCRQNGIPVLRRCTGGGTVLQGPGCFNYSLILRTDPSGPNRNIKATNDFIMNRHRLALAGLLRAPVEVCGHTDLAIGGLKFSGNAQRRGKNFLIFHGSLLLHLDFELIEHALSMPSREPNYRLGRSHSEFLMNLKVESSILKQAFKNTWAAADSMPLIPFDRITDLVREKYSCDEWNLRF